MLWSRVDRRHAEPARMQSFQLQSYAAHAYRHAEKMWSTQLTVKQTVRAAQITSLVVTILQPPPRSTCLWSTSITTGNPQFFKINPACNGHITSDLSTSEQIFSIQFYRLQLSVMTFQLQRISPSLINIIRTFVN